MILHPDASRQRSSTDVIFSHVLKGFCCVLESLEASSALERRSRRDDGFHCSFTSCVWALMHKTEVSYFGFGLGYFTRNE